MEETKVEKSWMERLHEEIMLANPEAFPPKQPVRKEDQVQGVCTDFMKRVWSLSRFLDREVKQAQLELEFAPEKDQALVARIDELQDKSKILLAIFWVEGQDAFGMWGHGKTIGVREGWKFVWRESKEPEIFKVLRELGED